MAKSKTSFFCQECGFESPKWLGKCSSCGAWNSFVEETVVTASKKNSLAPSDGYRPAPELLSDIPTQRMVRLKTGISELDRILGGGIVPGSVVLLGGEPGIGKSTLALQLVIKLKNIKSLYISGEESPDQIKLRADRLSKSGTGDCYILPETLLENIITQINAVSPQLVVIDSIQTLYSDFIESSPGSISQVRDCTARIQRIAKEKNIPVILIGHINKEGNLAGPKVLEHIVDTVLQFEGDNNYMYRILRPVKNRFGSTAELGIFEMNETGLVEIQNPSEILIHQHDDSFSGVSVTATIDGLRPFLIEIQALVSSAVYGTPQRSATGFDIRRLNMLLAVLEKKVGFNLSTKDVFLNIAGGIKITDPGIDLAVISAVLSSNLDSPIDMKTCFAGEVGLTGEIRPVQQIEYRINEAEKMGFSRIFIPRLNQKSIAGKKFSIAINPVSRVEDVFRNVFKK